MPQHPPGASRDPFDSVDLHARVDKALAAYLATQAAALHEVSPELSPVADAATALLLDGGKRMRPAFCYWGWRAAGGVDSDAIVAAAASLELLHGCALVHDDVMDGSDVRRRKPAAHRRFAALHRSEGLRGDDEWFGVSAAILLGDLCLLWADAMLAGSGLPLDALAAAQPVYDAMRVEVMAGQYLDLLEQARGGGSIERALHVARFKTAKYTVERPLHFGGRLSGASEARLATYSAYGLPLGEAFQLRDDVLGVFGDPAETGKPAGDDLREGKRTVLVAVAFERADARQEAVLRRHLGDPGLDTAAVDELRTVMTETGAVAAVEQLISRRTDEALAAIDGSRLPAEAADALRSLAVSATSRRL